MLLLALLLVLLNALFVAAEFSFVKVRRTQMELLAQTGNRSAKLALHGVHNLDAYLSVCQLGITLASLGLGWLGEPAVARLLAPLFSALSVGPALAGSLSVIVGFTFITLLHVVFGELVPKSISIQRAESTVLFLAAPMRVFYILWFPVVSVMNGISRAILHLVGFATASEAEETHSAEELRLMIIDSRKGGQLEDSEGRMLSNIFSFYKKTANDIMVHRVDVVALAVDDSLETATEVARRTGHTRFPVYDENRENIAGFIHAKDLLHHESGEGAGSLADIMRAPLYVYETAHLDMLLRLMQEKRQQFCVVVDEYGLWQGIITMEDVTEVIVGDIQDEFDNEAPDFLPQPDGSAMISAELSLDTLAAHMEVVCEDPEINVHKIIASHIIDRLGRIPAVGDHIALCGKLFTVASMDRHRVRTVRVSDIPAPEDSPERENAGTEGASGARRDESETNGGEGS